MPRVLFLVSSARELTFADGSTNVTGYFAEEALTPYERFTEAGVDVVVATADGKPPLPDPYGLEPFFHYPDEDEDFLASITRSFAHDVDDIRLTLRHMTRTRPGVGTASVPRHARAGLRRRERPRTSGAARPRGAGRKTVTELLLMGVAR